ncbi:3-oxoacyl-[acyl-carrier-protein] reductase [Desulfogranum japonicum]|uniref:3-oxoacyl-[acyl-carrier-protein] reductase n=1 Tax=Desulfogranum japonicum TaxID=231447 RepID=UPI0004225C77|nr:3-oxoacyl-[acyl-carrier-protein] reductase [Desulfogranum japonicum]
MTLEGKTAVITGGSRGIGRAICKKLAGSGFNVGINYVSNPTAAEETLALVEQQGGKGFLCPFNVADTDAVNEAFKKITQDIAPVDILINNAGITRDGLMARMKDSDWQAVMDTNLKGAFSCSKAAMRGMMKSKWGRIVNITSVIGFLGNGGQVNYAAAKAGLVGLTKSMARELAGRNITVNCVAPGYIVTDMTDGLDSDIQQAILAQIPLGSLGEPEDVAASVAFLTSDDAKYITGQTIHVNGGMYMGN